MIRKISTKRAAQMQEYKKLRDEWLPGKVCGVCKNVKATEIHHMAGKNGMHLIEVGNFLPICRKCHMYITENSAWSIEQGYSKRRNT